MITLARAIVEGRATPRMSVGETQIALARTVLWLAPGEAAPAFKTISLGPAESTLAKEREKDIKP